MKIADLRPADYNPRSITDKALAGLKTSLKEFGDISGIVWNKRTGNLVSGHQRVRALREEFGDELEITKQHLLLPTGEQVKVRIVDWDETKERAANLAANNPMIQGDFTSELAAVLEGVELSLPENLSLDLNLPEMKDLAPQRGGGPASDDYGPDPDSEQEAGSKLGGLEYRVVVTCMDESHQLELLERFEAEGLVCSALIS